MIPYLIGMIFAGGLVLLIGYLVKYKEMYGLINEISLRSNGEEQQKLIENGYPQAIGQLLINTGLIIIGTMLLGIFSIPNGVEIGTVILIIYVVAGFLYLHIKLGKVNKEPKSKGQHFATAFSIGFCLFLVVVVMIAITLTM